MNNQQSAAVKNQLKTLVRIVKLINGYELWYRLEGQSNTNFEKVFHGRRGK